MRHQYRGISLVPCNGSESLESLNSQFYIFSFLLVVRAVPALRYFFSVEGATFPLELPRRTCAERASTAPYEHHGVCVIDSTLHGCHNHNYSQSHPEWVPMFFSREHYLSFPTDSRKVSSPTESWRTTSPTIRWFCSTRDRASDTSLPASSPFGTTVRLFRRTYRRQSHDCSLG